jgi:hypothetical protein
MSNEAERNIFDKIIVGAFTIIIGVNSLLITLIIAGAARSNQS